MLHVEPARHEPRYVEYANGESSSGTWWWASGSRTAKVSVTSGQNAAVPRASNHGPVAKTSRCEPGAVAPSASRQRPSASVTPSATSSSPATSRTAILAAGRSPEEMLAELRRRLGNDAETERAEVVEQLAQITELRVRGLVDA